MEREDEKTKPEKYEGKKEREETKIEKEGGGD